MIATCAIDLDRLFEEDMLGDDLDGQEPVEPNVELDALGVSQATRTRLARHCAAILSGTA